jgi:mRNA interferase MazF
LEERRLKRGELWIAAIDKMRPVLILSTFTGLYDLQIIPATTRIRGLATEVRLGPADGLNYDCVLNAQQLQLVSRNALSARIGELRPDKLAAVCRAVKESIGC